MPIHTGGDAFTVTTEPQITHRGVKLALKVADFGAAQFVYVLEAGADGKWTPSDLVWFEDGAIGSVGDELRDGPAVFIRNVLVPRLNAWLRARFPPLDTPMTPIQQLDAALGLIRWAPQPDGTLVVTAA